MALTHFLEKPLNGVCEKKPSGLRAVGFGFFLTLCLAFSEPAAAEPNCNAFPFNEVYIVYPCTTTNGGEFCYGSESCTPYSHPGCSGITFNMYCSNFPQVSTQPIALPPAATAELSILSDGQSRISIEPGASYNYTLHSAGVETCYLIQYDISQGGAPKTTNIPWTANTTTTGPSSSVGSTTMNCTTSAGQKLSQTLFIDYKASTKKIDAVGEKNLTEQEATHEATIQINSLGANQLATTAAIDCAEGAIIAKSDPEAAGPHLASCDKRFAAANEMKKNEQKAAKNSSNGEFSGSLQAALEVLEAPRSKAALSAFETNCQITGEEYMSSMLKARGHRETFTGMLASCLTENQISKAFAAAGDSQTNLEDPNKFLSKIGDDEKKISGSEKREKSLRTALRKKLAEKEEGARRPSEVLGKGTRIPAGFDHLDPLDAKGLFPTSESQMEFTLFDVVRRKYRQLWERTN